MPIAAPARRAQALRGASHDRITDPDQRRRPGCPPEAPPRCTSRQERPGGASRCRCEHGSARRRPDALDRSRSGSGDRRERSSDPAGDDVPARLLPGDLDTVRRERIERLGLDQRQLVAAAAPRERPAFGRSGRPEGRYPRPPPLSRTRTSGASAAGATSNPATTPLARQAHRTVREASRPSWKGATTTASASEPPPASSAGGIEHRSGGDAEHEHRIAVAARRSRQRSSTRARRTTPGRRSARGRGCGPRATGARRPPGRRPASGARRLRARAPRRGSERTRFGADHAEQRTPTSCGVVPEPTASVTLPHRGHVHDAVSRMQGLVRRRAGDPRAAARRRPPRGDRRRQTSP